MITALVIVNLFAAVALVMTARTVWFLVGELNKAQWVNTKLASVCGMYEGVLRQAGLMTSVDVEKLAEQVARDGESVN